MELTSWCKASASDASGGDCVELAAWRKSSTSAGNGGDCVEVADWRKSSASGSNGGACVEVGDSRGVVAVRDSKDPDGPVLAFSAGAFQSFVEDIKGGKI
ncbi:DUF397 domain-containing protein [Actinomadura rudentiformis]|uniref:DUF397 domain-containing protein n=1 Tax=Actinomadura rudentiformis TaxID=359158 RepID=A0A6H9Y619_9ACTN|nr:DUF397 domain-containing protein [Actinomadura rudentiformis]KAB2339604.1 DUF397 domain-containing protein [Actinomadura rudentiformis]